MEDTSSARLTDNSLNDTEKRKCFRLVFINILKKFDALDQSIMFKPQMHEIFSQRYCMKWVPGDPQKKMLN